MSTNRNPNNKNQNTSETPSIEKEAEVLFQRIFNKWYAFSTDGEECFMTEITEEEVRARAKKSKAA